MESDASWGPAATWAVAFAAAVALTCVLAATGGTHRTGVDLAAYSALAALCMTRTQWWSVVPVAATFWLFFTGFLVNRHGEIVWHGTTDCWRIGVILAASIAGLLAGRALAPSASRSQAPPPDGRQVTIPAQRRVHVDR